MKYDIVHSCGCEETVDIFGTNVHGERDRKAERLASKPCRACEAKAKARADAEEGFAPLEGSERQIAWALDIRRRMVSGLSSLRARGMSPEREANVVRALKRETSAAWFIDRRDESPEHVYADIAQKEAGVVDTAFGAIRLVDNVSDGRFSIFTPGGMVYWFGTLGAAEDAAEVMRVMWEAGIDAEREMGMKPYSYNDSMVEGRR